MNYKVCVIKYIFDKSFITPSRNLENILLINSEKLFVINCVAENIELIESENDLVVLNVFHKRYNNKISRIMGYFYLQLNLSYNLMKIAKNIDICIFFTESGIFLPLLTAKLLNKRVLWLLPSFFQKMALLNQDIFSKFILNPFESFSKLLVDNIVLYSPNLVKEWGLENYKKKIVFAHEHYLNFDKFNPQKSLNKRSNIIGFVGRFSHEKGICEFVESIELLNEDEYNFIIIGDGKLNEDVRDFIKNHDLVNIKIVDWVEHDRLPDYLNEMKLLVIPSFTEGLPNIMLEAMACGTPVLAMSTGTIPDLIIDGVTGFLMESNSPKCISNNIIRALTFTQIDEISYNALNLVKKNFDKDQTAKKWSIVFQENNNE